MTDTTSTPDSTFAVALVERALPRLQLGWEIEQPVTHDQFVAALARHLNLSPEDATAYAEAGGLTVDGTVITNIDGLDLGLRLAQLQHGIWREIDDREYRRTVPACNIHQDSGHADRYQPCNRCGTCEQLAYLANLRDDALGSLATIAEDIAKAMQKIGHAVGALRTVLPDWDDLLSADDIKDLAEDLERTQRPLRAAKRTVVVLTQEVTSL
jgi:hypothetical protein